METKYETNFTKAFIYIILICRTKNSMCLAQFTGGKLHLICLFVVFVVVVLFWVHFIYKVYLVRAFRIDCRWISGDWTNFLCSHFCYRFGFNSNLEIVTNDFVICYQHSGLRVCCMCLRVFTWPFIFIQKIRLNFKLLKCQP